MEQETGSHSGEGPEESLIVRCSDAVGGPGGGGAGGGAGTHLLNGSPTLLKSRHISQCYKEQRWDGVH